QSQSLELSLQRFDDLVLTAVDHAELAERISDAALIAALFADLQSLLASIQSFGSVPQRAISFAGQRERPGEQRFGAGFSSQAGAALGQLEGFSIFTRGDRSFAQIDERTRFFKVLI